MKKIILYILLALVIVVIGFCIYISTAVNEKNVFYYKLGNHCSDFTQRKMKSQESYKNDGVFIVINPLKQQEEKLFVNKSEILKKLYNEDKIEVKNIYTYVSYRAKNGFGVELNDKAICEYNSFEYKDGIGQFSPSFVTVQIGDTLYEGEGLWASGLEIPLIKSHWISFIDKINYFFNSSNTRIIQR